MRTFCFAVLIHTIAALSAPTTAEETGPAHDPRAEKLLRDIEARRSLPITDKHWSFENGPWAEHLNSEPKTQPSEKREMQFKDRFAQAKRDNDCPKMIKLLQERFLQRHPYLRPAHAKARIKDYFMWTVTYEVVPSTLHCRAKAELNLALQFSKRHNLRIFPFFARRLETLSQPKFERRSDDTPQDRARNTLCMAVTTLGRAAIGYKNVSAIRDLLHYSRAPSPIELSPEQKYAVFRVATRLGLTEAQAGGLGTLLSAGLDPKTRGRIDRLLAEKTIPRCASKHLGHTSSVQRRGSTRFYQIRSNRRASMASAGREFFRFLIPSRAAKATTQEPK